jgi:hypothetical protein
MPRRGSQTSVVALTLLGLFAAGSVGLAQEAAGPKIAFLSADEAAAVLATEALDPYFDSLQPLEMSAKTGRGIVGAEMSAQRAECRRRYIEAAQDFNGDEIATLARVVARLDAHLRRHYPRVVEQGWSFLKLDSHIEGGLPHALGTHIALSPRFLAAYVGEPAAASDENLWSLGVWLLHKQLHVVQRRHPRLFGSLYKGVWGFRRLEALDPHPWLLEHQVANPDTGDEVWVYRVQTATGPEWIWPTIVFGESRGVRRLLGVPSLARDIRMVAVALDRTDDSFSLRLDSAGMPVVRRLLSFQEYRSEFPFSVAPYHPGEIAAEGFARVVIAELAGESREEGAPAAAETLDPRTERLRRWLAGHLD